MRGLVMAVAVLLAGCMDPRPLASPAGVTLTPLRSISTLEASALLRLAGVKGVPVANAVDCYRMQYEGAGRGGERVRLSGLLALPHGVAPRRLVSFQHGTTTTRSAVPSRPDGTGIATAIAFGGNGYALVVPDYPGLGASDGRHPYYVADAIGPAIVAMIRAARTVEGVPSTPVLLAGFSEGGWASMVALRLLEAQGERVLGSAQVAGPYDLRRISIPATLVGDAPSGPLYMAYLAWGQSAYHGHRLDSALTPANAVLVERLFAGATPKQIMDALPKAPRQLFNEAFLDAYDRNGSHWLLDSLTENSIIDMTPRAPVRLYYGARDRDVVPEEARNAARVMRARGADVTAIDVGPVGHDQSMLEAAPLILDWFRALEGVNQS